MGSQCFLFVKENNASTSKSASSKWKDFVLLPSTIKSNPKTCEIFTKRSNVEVLKGGDCFPAFQSALESDQLEIVELIVLNENLEQSKNRKTSAESTRLHLSVESNSEDIISRIFRRNAIVSKITSHNGILNVTDAENVSLMNDILSVRPNIRLRDSKGGSLLHLAAMRGDTTLAKMLLEHGLEVDLKNNEGATPLHLASRHGNVRIVELLLTKGALVNAEQENGATSLHLAAEGGWLDVYKLLTSNGASITVKFDVTVLVHAAVEKSHIDILNDLLQAGVKLNSILDKGRTPLYLAVEKGHTAVVKWLLDHGANVNVERNTFSSPLCVAVGNSNLELVKVLLTHGAVVESSDIMKAAEVGNAEVLETLLLKVANCSAQVIEPAFCKAISKGNLDAIEVILRYGAIINGNAISKAAFVPNAEIMKTLLLKAGNLSAETINPAFLNAVSKGNLDVVESLLRYGAVANENVIYEASKAGNIEVMKTLLNGNIPATMIKGAFLQAVYNNNLEMVKLLLRSGAEINAKRDYDKSFAIHYASVHLECDMVKLLIANNANIELKDDTGRTPLYTAAQQGRVAVFNHLLTLGARIDVLDNLQKPAFFYVVVFGAKSTFKNVLDALFLTPQFVVEKNVWKIFNESRLKEEYRKKIKLIQNSCAEFERLSIKIKAAKPGFNDDEIILPWHVKGVDDFRSDCEAEIARMKTLTIADTRVNFYDILMKDVQPTT